MTKWKNRGPDERGAGRGADLEQAFHGGAGAEAVVRQGSAELGEQFRRLGVDDLPVGQGVQVRPGGVRHPAQRVGRHVQVKEGISHSDSVP